MQHPTPLKFFISSIFRLSFILLFLFSTAGQPQAVQAAPAAQEPPAVPDCSQYNTASMQVFIPRNEILIDDLNNVMLDGQPALLTSLELKISTAGVTRFEETFGSNRVFTTHWETAAIRIGSSDLQDVTIAGGDLIEIQAVMQIADDGQPVACTRSMTVADIVINPVIGAWEVNGEVSGNKPFNLRVNPYDPSYTRRNFYVTPNEDGQWMFNLAANGYNGVPLGLTISYPADSWTTTFVTQDSVMRVPAIEILVDYPEVHLRDFIPGEQVDIYVYDFNNNLIFPNAYTLQNPFTISAEQENGVTVPLNFPMLPGYRVVVSYLGGYINELIVKNIRLTKVDYTTNTLEGTAPPNTNIRLMLNCYLDGVGCLDEYDLDNDETSEWLVTPPEMILDPSAIIYASIFEGSGNETTANAGYHPENYSITIQPNHNWVCANKWPVGKNVFFIADNDRNHGNGVLDVSNPITVERDGYCAAQWNLDPASDFDLLPDQYITVTDGVYTRTMRIQQLTFEQFDVQTGFVRGTGEPGEIAEVVLLFTSGHAEPVVAADGTWQATLAPYTMDAAWDLFVKVREDDGDETMVHWNGVIDWDQDGVWNNVDTAPYLYNPDNRDIDGDGVGDVADPCPYDDTDTCNTAGSAAVSIGSEGGELATPDESALILVPPAALAAETSISITAVEFEPTYLLEDGTETSPVYGVEIGPPGTQFATPITVTLTWPDANNDGYVDGAGQPENDLFISKDGVIITQRCSQDPGCSPTDNTFSVQVSGLSEFVLVTITAAAPEITSLKAPVDPVQVGTQISATAVFSDANPGDTFTAAWSWGDGSSDQSTVSAGTITAAHTYNSTGVYTVQLTITDQTGLFTVASYSYIVAYDPNGGFVTGGGWIDSPSGAYTVDPALSGKATFGFVSRYQKGASLPTGNTEFQFKAGSLNFKSSAYQWLVIAGSKAMYKGEGAINGVGAYGFLLSAIDGDQKGGDGVDRFRIKIWELASGAVIYDNQMAAPDDASPVTAIGGGSIVIHK